MLLISMTLIRVVTAELAFKLILILPKESLQVDLVADCYFENSISAAERVWPCSATKIITKLPKSKVLRSFSKFLSNGEKETHKFELLIQKIKEKRLHALRTPYMILSQ